MRVYFFLIIFSLIFVNGCGQRKNKINPEHLSTKTAAITQTTFYNTYNGYGQLQSIRATELITRFSGVIHINEKRNSFYKEGELIYSLSGSDFVRKEAELHAVLMAAESSYQFAKDRLQRRKSLRKQEFLSKENWQELQRDFDLAKQALQKAKSNWNYFKKMTRTCAPYDGILSNLAVSQGDYVQTGTRVAQFLGASRLKLVINYFGDPTFLKRSPQITVFLNDSLKAPGRVIFQSHAVETGTGGHQLWIELHSLKGDLVPGMFVKFELRFDGYRAPAVPEEALVREGNRYFVVIQKNGRYENQQVKIGKRSGAFRELIQGPPIGTRVVTTSAFEYFYKNLEKTMNVED